MARTPRSSRPRASSTTSLADPSSLVGHAWGANYPTLLRSGVDLFDCASRGAPLYLKMGIWLALFFSVLATVAHAEVTWNQMGDDAGPARRVGRKLTSSNVGDFTLVDISSTISYDWKFDGAAAASNGKIVFGPRNADGMGVFDPSDNSFELVDISSTISGNAKFRGAAVASNGKIIFAPNNADGVGVFDPPCDTSNAPTNGGVGDCTRFLPSGSTCQPTCDSGYIVSGTSSCTDGTLTAATCSEARPPLSPSPPPLSPVLEAPSSEGNVASLCSCKDRFRRNVKKLKDPAFAEKTELRKRQ